MGTVYRDLIKEMNKQTEHPIPEMIVESDNVVDVLRDNGYKIKLITPTSFGTQIDFARKYDEDELSDILKDVNYRIKGKSLFIVQ